MKHSKTASTSASMLYLCQTCSEGELLYFFDMRFLIVSFTDLTFLPSEIRDVVGDLTTSLYIASCSLLCDHKIEKREQKKTERQMRGDGNETLQIAQGTTRTKRDPKNKREISAIKRSRRVQLVLFCFTRCYHLHWPRCLRWPHGGNGWTGQSLQSCMFSEGEPKHNPMSHTHQATLQNFPFHTQRVNSQWFMLGTTRQQFV